MVKAASSGESWRILPMGERALLIEAPGLSEVLDLHAALVAASPDGVVDVVPAARTVLVHVDPAILSLASARAWIDRALTGDVRRIPSERVEAQAVELAVRYDGADLADTAAVLGISPDELARRHAAATWSVAFTGFAPGFGYLVSDAWSFDVPRLESPRTRVPAGSVGLAAGFTGAYPRDTPGGWRLIGTTDAPLFDPAAAQPALLAPGTRVRFIPVPSIPPKSLASPASASPAPASSTASPASPASVSPASVSSPNSGWVPPAPAENPGSPPSAPTQPESGHTSGGSPAADAVLSDAAASEAGAATQPGVATVSSRNSGWKTSPPAGDAGTRPPVPAQPELGHTTPGAEPGTGTQSRAGTAASTEHGTAPGAGTEHRTAPGAGTAPRAGTEHGTAPGAGAEAAPGTAPAGAGRGIEVIEAGLLATVQDLGRPGHAALGVARSGALDRAALRAGNRLVGNPEGAAGIEITMGGFRARAATRLWFAVTGAWGPVTLDGRPVDPYTAHEWPAGAELHVDWAEHGVRAMLAVRGGVAGPRVLGSRSTDVMAGLGPDRLAAGAHVEVGPDPAAPVPVAPTATWGAPPDEIELRLAPGPRSDWFDDDARVALFDGEWTVAADADRVGVRLDGPVLTRRRAGELPSEGMVPGALQVAPTGRPTVLLADGPVTGGYPVIAVVADADLDLLAQARPGSRIRFRHVRHAG